MNRHFYRHFFDTFIADLLHRQVIDWSRFYMPVRKSKNLDTSEVEARRAFLKNCAKFAAAMPPAISLLISADEAFGAPKKCSAFCTDPSPPQPPSCTCPEFSATFEADPIQFESAEEQEFNSGQEIAGEQ
jgi:hypothetical protein